MNDPTVQLRRRLWLMRIIALGLITPALIWSLASNKEETSTIGSQIGNVDAPPGTPPAPQFQDDFDAALFAVKLWNPAPGAADDTATSVESAPPPAPPRIQLVGIINESGALHAALYDLAAEKLIILGPGQSIQNFTLEQITSERVVLSDGRVRHELRIREGRS